MQNGSRHTLESIRELFYQAQVRKVLEITDVPNGAEVFGSEWRSILFFRSAALYELHMPQQALATLQNIAGEDDQNEGEVLYAKARIEYQLCNYDAALAHARGMITNAKSLRDRFRGLLVECNVYYSKGELDRIPEFLEELRPLSEQLPVEDKIGLIMLRANYERSKGGVLLQAAKESYCEAATLASARSWSHFSNRAFYCLALALKAEGLEVELRSTLRLLRCLVVPNEQLFLAYLINSDFKDDNFSIGVPVEFEESRMRITVNGKVLALHEKPLIFNFLHSLHEHDKFLSKEELSERLWVGERYNPLIHDARIFDIAKRARAVIETFDQQPVVLLSGRLGYKLARK